MTERKQLVFPKTALFMVIIAGWCALSLALTFYEKSTDSINFTSSIDSLFHGNKVISSNTTQRVNGNLNPIQVEPVGLRELMGPSHKNDMIIISGNDAVMPMPELPHEYASPEAVKNYQEKLAEWSKVKDLSDYFQCAAGGFTILEISKQPTGYNIVEYVSENMGFKIPDRKWLPEINSGYGFVTPGRYISTGRVSVQQAYDGASEYLATRNDATYRGSDIQETKMFPVLRSKYHLLSNVAPLDLVRSEIPLAGWTSKGRTYAENDQWMVWFSFKGKHYEITEDTVAFYRHWLIYSSIGVLALLIVGSIYFVRKRFSIKLG